MRWLLALLLVAPLGMAQAPIELATLAIEPFPANVEPLKEPTRTTLRLRASCALADGTEGTPVTYSVVDAPAWATTLLLPATDVLSTIECDDGWVERQAELILTASDQAPAFLATPIVVEASVGSGPREQKARASVNASASYFGILDVQVPSAVLTMAPGETRETLVRVTSFGNADTRVETTLVEAGEGLSVDLPAPVTLESRQAGGTRTSEDLVFRLRAATQEGFVSRVGIVSARLASHYATDDSYPGDGSTVSFVVTVRSAGVEAAKDLTPAGWAPLALAALALSAARSRASWRRPRR